MDSFVRLKRWLLDSGLAVTNAADNNKGGVYSHYDVGVREYGFLYPEITGYYVSALGFLNCTSPDLSIVSRAKTSADWLSGIYAQYGGIPQGIYEKKRAQNLWYTFDTGVCAQGLLDCHLMTGEQKYMETAETLLGWIAEEALTSDGTIKPVYDVDSGRFVRDDNLWYKQKCCLHIKAAIPFCTLYGIKNDPALLETIHRICGALEKFRLKDGSVAIHQNSGVIHMHTMCYAAEGLLRAFAATGNVGYLEDVCKSLDWVVQRISGDGSTHLWFNSRYRQSKTSYHVAQLVRLMILADRATGDTKYYAHARTLAGFLLTLQAESTDARADGGFYEERRKTLIGWRRSDKINSWGSMFALQALHWLECYDSIDFADTVEMLY